MKNDWSILNVSEGIDSEVNLNRQDIVTAFLAENGIYEGNPLIEFIDLKALSKKLLNEVDDMPPPKVDRPPMVSQQPGGVSSLASRIKTAPASVLYSPDIAQRANVTPQLEPDIKGGNVDYAAIEFFNPSKDSKRPRNYESDVIGVEQGLKSAINSFANKMVRAYGLGANDINYVKNLITVSSGDDDAINTGINLKDFRSFARKMAGKPSDTGYTLLVLRFMPDQNVEQYYLRNAYQRQEYQHQVKKRELERAAELKSLQPQPETKEEMPPTPGLRKPSGE